jgi:hypothetical protein
MKLGHVHSPPAIGSPSLVQIAWAAGFIEGEGTFAGRSSYSRTEHVSAPQLQKEPLTRLVEYFGGSIHCRRTAKGKKYYNWQATGSRARGVMLAIFSFMSPRRRNQIKAALRGK